MQIQGHAAQPVQQPGTDRAPPPPPPLTAVQSGEVAAGRLHVAEGRVFDGISASAPRTTDWGSQPAGSGYREAFDGAAARLGTTDPAQVGAELDRQLYAQAPTASPAPVPAAANDREGVGSFVEGAILGDFGDNSSWSATAGQVVVGFVPVAGQIADLRDTAASIGQVIRGENGGWLNLGASVVGWVPGIGDAAKAAIRGGSNVADAGTEVAQGAARHVDDAASGGARIDPPPSSNGVPGATIAETASRTGIPEARVREILDTPKPVRPDPSTYLSPERIAAHLRPFEESGAIRFTPQSSIDRYGTLGPPDGGFIMPRADFERLVEETGGDLGRIEARLQLEPGTLTRGDNVIAYIAPEDLNNLRIPSGNERGAWDGMWVPGGYTGQGVPEAVVDLPAGTPYTPVTLGE